MTSPETSRVVQGVTLHLSSPDPTEQGWIGQAEVLRQLLACWLVVDDSDRPLSPRLLGPPGIGKTTLAMAAARHRRQPLYVVQCTADTRPEDLLVTPVTGAYGHSMGSNYNKITRPPVVFVADGTARLVVRRETYDDLLVTDLG